MTKKPSCGWVPVLPGELLARFPVFCGGVEGCGNGYVQCAERGHDFLQVVAAQLVRSGIENVFAIEALHDGVVVGAKPAKCFVPQAF